MNVIRPVELTWKGEKYSTLITMRDVDRFEQDPNINLEKMAERLVLGDSRKSHAANLMSKVLNLAGCKATQEDIFYGLCDLDIDIGFTELDAILGEILDACFIKVKKNQPAKKKSQKATRGKAGSKS